MAEAKKDVKPSALTNDFVHLRAISSMSMVTSLVSIDDIIELSEKDDMKSVAITDVQRMFGTIKHIKHAKDKGLKPIIGVEVLIKPNGFDQKFDDQGHILNPDLKDYTQGEHSVILLCNSEASYKYLIKFVSDSWVKNQINDLPYILESDIQKIRKTASLKDGEDLGFAVLLGGQKTWLGKQLSSDTANPAFKNSIEYIDWMKSIFGNESIYLELQRIAHTDEEAKSEFDWINRSVALSNKTGVEYVATHPFMFNERKDWYANEIRTQSSIVGEVYTGEESYATPEQHWLTTEQMKERFSDLPKAITTVEKLSVSLGNNPPLLGKYFLPDFPIPEGSKLDFDELKEGTKIRQRLENMYQKIPATELEGLSDHDKEHKVNLTKLLTRKSWEGFLDRMKEDQPFKDNDDLKRVYMERFFYETEMIVSMGFTGYFLIVSDFIQWSKNNDIPVGPGRGSGAGSLVAWSLKITDIDPIPYGLIFERFLNPERVSMPDFDIDFCQAERGRVIEYVKDKYGRDKVGQIATVSTAKAKAAIGIVGRTIYGKDAGAKNQYMDLSSMVPKKPVDIKLSTALKEKKNLKHEYRTDAVAKQIIDYALTIENVPTNPGKGAAGLVISPTTLDDFSPLYIDQKILNEHSDTEDAPLVCQYNKEDIETAGLVKFDFLGLANLTVLKMANKYAKLNLSKLDIKDKAAYDIITAGNTVGIFQIESQKMQELMRDIRPDKIEEVIALIALYRPGPMDLIPTFAARKKGEEPVEYPDPRVESVLKETYGVMVYQEQVMQMSQIVGGYTLGGADLLRRAMGKKKPEEMVKHRAIFRDGAMKNGVGAEKADAIFSMMEKFAGYGFNKSHAAAYALITFQTAYMKAHYPVAFYSALMTVADDPVKVAKYKRDALNYIDFRGSEPVPKPLRLLAPDINFSGEKEFAPSDRLSNSIEYSLKGLKGINQLDVKYIVAERKENGLFDSLEDFVKRCHKKINVTTLKVLIGSGALDSMIPEEMKPKENAKPWSGREWLSENAALIHDYIKSLKKETSKMPGGTIKMPKIDQNDLFAQSDMPVKPKRTRKNTVEKITKEIVWPQDKFVVPEKIWTEVEAMAQETKNIGYEFSGSIANYYHSLFSNSDGGGLTFSNMDVLVKDNTDGKTGRDYAKKHIIQGVPVEVYNFTTGKGEAMAKVLLDDGVDLYDIVVFNSCMGNLPHKLEKMPWIAINCGIPYDKKAKEKKEEKEKEKARTLERLKVKEMEDFDSSEPSDHNTDDGDTRETQDFSIAAVDFFTESSLFERWASSLKVSRKTDFDKVVKLLTPFASPDNFQTNHNVAVEFSGTSKVAYISRDYKALKALLDTYGDDKVRVNMRPLKISYDFNENGGNKMKEQRGYDPRSQAQDPIDLDAGVGPVSSDIVDESKARVSNVLKFKEDNTNQAVSYQKNDDLSNKSEQTPRPPKKSGSSGFKPRLNG